MTTDFQYDVFISYARADGADHASKLRDTFRELDKRTYLDTSMIESGQKWEQNLHDSLLSAKAMIFVLTAGSVDPDSYCKIEWEMAVEHNIPILPVRVDTKVDFTMSKPYSTIQYIDLTNDWDIGIDEISHFLTRYDYLYELRDELNNLVSSSTARRFIEIIATENAAAKQQLKRRVKVRIPKRQQAEAIEFSSFRDAWQHYNGQVLLLGAAGAGKTTTLLHYAQTLVTNYLANRNQPVPVFASIAYWDSYANQPLHEWLPEENDLPDAMRDVIDNGRAVLILDGLDELGSSKPLDPEKPEKGTFDPRLRFIKHVQTAIDMGNQILITSRVIDYDDIGEKLNIKGAIELQPLTDDQIDTYLGDVPTVQTTVMADDELLDICRSPLLLSLIAFGYRDATDDLKTLPNMAEGDLRDTIFEQYITTSYDLEARRRELTGEEMPFTLGKVMDVLGHAAMFNVGGISRITGGSITIVENVLEYSDFMFHLYESEIDKFIEVVQKMNIIAKNNLGNGSFLHLLIRDFLAYNFSIRNLSDSNYYDQYCTPANALGKLKDTRATKILMQLLQHESHFIRSSCIKAIGAIGDNKAIAPIINALQFDPESQVRVSAAHALINIHNVQSIEILIYTLQNDPNAKVRNAWAFTLGYIGNEKSIDSLIRSLKHDENPQVRTTAATALGQLGNQRAVLPLLEALENDPDEIMPRTTVMALGKLGDKVAIDSLVKVLHSKTNHMLTRIFAAGSLGNIGDETCIEPLVHALYYDGLADVKLSCAKAIIDIAERLNIRPTAALIAILVFNFGYDWDMPRKVAELLQEIGTPEAIHAVQQWHMSLKRS